jgi:hypothetical protein
VKVGEVDGEKKLVFDATATEPAMVAAAAATAK